MNEQPLKSARIESLASGLLVAFLVAALALGYWAIVRAPQLAGRADNPRVVEAELQIRRGRILDTDGVVLAETIIDDGAPVRHYPVETIGPAVGYYSFRHGTAGVEQGYNDILRGADDASWEALWKRALHQPGTGQDIRLTLDANWQQEVDRLLGNQMGAVVVLSVPDGAVKVLVSHPGYDPNILDAEFSVLSEDSHAPLLNRVTQGQYQPGLALQPFIIALALDQEIIQMNDAVEGADASIAVRNAIIRCRESPPDESTWVTVLHLACPAPMVDLAQDISPQALVDSFERLGFYSQPDFELQTALVESQPISNVENAILGQGLMVVTPLQMVRAWATLASEGTIPTPYLVQQVQNETGALQALEQSGNGIPAMDPSTAVTVLSSLSLHDGEILEHSTTALSGPEEATTAWYLGFAPAQSPRYAIVVVTESAADAGITQEIGRAALRLAPETN